MCQEVFNIVQSMDSKSVELQLILQCAPLITGIKISNLFIIDSANEGALMYILKHSGISSFRLLKSNGKTIFLLFRRKQLEQYLARHDVVTVLKGMSYYEFSFGGILRQFKNRYEAYKNQEMQFPHEMGLLLGYPVEDVKGFIVNNGQNYQYAGYWKVYSNVFEKKELFSKYETSKEKLIQMLVNNLDIRFIIKHYNDTYVLSEID